MKLGKHFNVVEICDLLKIGQRNACDCPEKQKMYCIISKSFLLKVRLCMGMC